MMKNSFIKVLTLAGALTMVTGCSKIEEIASKLIEDDSSSQNSSSAPIESSESSNPSESSQVTPSSSSSSSAAPSSSSSSSGGGSASKVEISFWHTFGQTSQDNLKPQIQKVQELVKKNEGVDVPVNLVPESNYDTIKEDISKGIEAGQGNIPTIAVAYPDHAADYIEAEGNQQGKYLVNLNDYINNKDYGLGTEAYLGDAENDSIDDFIPSYIEGGQKFTREGQYTMPYMKSTEAMLYNYDAVVKVLAHYKPELQGAEEAIKDYMNNLDWDEFMELCRQVATYKDEINPALKVAAFYDSDSNMFISQLYQSSIGYASIVTNDAGKKVGHIDFAEGENRTKAEAMVSKLRNLYNENVNGIHLFTTKGVFSTYGSDSFKNVESVFTIGSTGGSGYSITSAFQLGVCRVPPMVKNNPLYVTQGPDLCIFNNPTLSDTANKTRTLYAWKLLKYLTNSENNCNICLLGSEGYLPVRQSSYEEDLYFEFLESGEAQATIAELVTEKIGNSYFNAPCFPGSAELREQCKGIITLSLSTDNPISGIFDTAINNAILKIK